MPVMRAKMKVNFIEKWDGGETLKLSAVCKDDGYGDDGVDENNTYSRFTPSAELSITINNPELLDKFAIGDAYYLDFTKAEQ